MLFSPQYKNTIKIGKKGNCTILGRTAITIADSDYTLVEQFMNMVEKTKTNTSLKSCGEFEAHSVAAKS